jgi:cyanate permease
MSAITPGGGRAWTLLLAFSLLLFVITGTSYASLGVLLTPMIADIGMSYPQAGLGFTLLGLANGLFAYLPALLIRRLGAVPTLACGVIAMVGGFVLLADARALGPYYLGAAMIGGGFVLLAIIPGTYVLGRCFERPALPFAVYYTLGGLGAGAGPFMVMAAGRLAQGWRGYWWTAAALVALCGLLCLVLVSRWRAAEHVQTKGPKLPVAEGDFTVAAALRTPQFAVVTLGYLAHLLCAIATTSFAVSHLTERGIEAATAASMLGLEGFFAAVARLVAGALGERVHPRALLAVSAACLVVGCTALAYADGYPGMVLYAFGVGSGFGAAQLACTLLLLKDFGRSRNLELFSLMCLSGAAAAFGPYAAGLLRDASGGFAPSFLACAAVAALVMLAAALMRSPRASRTSAA